MRRSTVYASVAGVLTCSVAFGGYIALSDLDGPGEPELGGVRPVLPSVDDPRAAAPPDEGGLDKVREQRERREMRAGLPLPTSTPTPTPTPGRTAPPVVTAPAPAERGADVPESEPEGPAAAAPEPTEPPRRDMVAPGPPPADDEPARLRIRTITYEGARFAVPAHWPVYRLDEDPERCVRFDEHAVYLGVHSEDQHCPGAAIGRTEALHVRPYDAERYRDAPAEYPLRTGPSARVPDTVAREVHARGHGLLFLATFDENRALIERILRSVRAHHTAAEPAPSPSTTPTTTPTTSPTATPTSSPTATPTTSPSASAGPTLSPSPSGSPSALPTTSPTPSPTLSPTPTPSVTPTPGDKPRPDPDKKPEKPKKPDNEKPDKKPKKKPKKKSKKKAAVKLNGRGFDTCAAPSLRAMRAWRGAFDAANIYIGGAARACGYGNLSKSWVRKVKKMGWHLIPTYVGFQAPCAPFRTRMTPSRAASQGKASADDAIERAKHFGLPKGVPIYFDMEAYDSGNDRCRRAVLLFLDAWSERLKDRGYKSGVYSSASAAARDLGRSVGIRLPDSIWFAQWDGRPSVWDTPYLSDKWWAKRQRIKQYRGPHRERHGGYTLTIDSNRVYGHVW